MPTTTKQFKDALAELMEGRELSGYELERRTRELHPAPEGKWSKLSGSGGYYGADHPGLSRQSISALLRGELPVSPRAIEVLSHALAIAPETFPEYRLDVARAELDWRTQGVKRALAVLERARPR